MFPIPKLTAQKTASSPPPKKKKTAKDPRKEAFDKQMKEEDLTVKEMWDLYGPFSKNPSHKIIFFVRAGYEITNDDTIKFYMRQIEKELKTGKNIDELWDLLQEWQQECPFHQHAFKLLGADIATEDIDPSAIWESLGEVAPCEHDSDFE